MSWLAEPQVRAIAAPPPRLVREHRFVERAVFAGGLPGCGKSLITALLGSFKGVEIQIYKEEMEHICSLRYLGRMEEDAATAVIRLMTDMDLYNVMQSRETNFRFSDCSSIFRNPGTLRYLRRLFQPGDAAAADRIRSQRPILQILMHNLLVLIPPVFRALGDSLRVIEVVRHPLYMVKQWHLYMDRYGADPRDFSICFDYRGRSLPFFALGWEEVYLAANPMDRVIHSMDRLTRRGEEVIQALSDSERARFLRIPFEPFVLDPWPTIGRIERLLGTERTPLTLRELKRQNVPRKRIADGIPLPIYRLNGWQPAGRGATERAELDRRREFARQQATPEGMRVLDRISAEYEARYMEGIL
ncbi:MAG: hypothetical protein HYZ93_02030 [Candidatus Omnitrophica bacterium]|nr:hypothetical protein [Candidatus Omnitrophota bacterium]